MKSTRITIRRLDGRYAVCKRVWAGMNAIASLPCSTFDRACALAYEMRTEEAKYKDLYD